MNNDKQMWFMKFSKSFYSLAYANIVRRERYDR